MKDILKNKKIVVVYNLKANNYTENYSDFFSQEEFDFIFKLGNESSYPIDFIEGELSFIEQINYYFPVDIVVLNLTRRGSSKNKKSTVTSICDLKNIKYIGSSTLTMNLCRNKYYLYPLLKQINVKYPVTIKKNGYTQLDLDNLQGKHCIIKNNDSAGSINLDKDSVKKFSNNILNQVAPEQVIQEYIEGYELEVPFIIHDSKIKILGFFLLVIDGVDYYSHDSKNVILDHQKSDVFDYELKKIELNYDIVTSLEKIIEKVVDLIEIENYGRIDFRTSKLNDINSFFIFDIATSPFFTKNTSLYLSIENNNIFDVLMETII